MPEISYLAVVLAAAASFGLGGVWYSPLLFAKAWQRESGVSDAQIKDAHMGLIFGTTFVLCLMASYVFALFLGPHPKLLLGAGAGFAAGVFWVASSFGINYLFERRSMKLFLINGGYHALQFTITGTVISLVS